MENQNSRVIEKITKLLAMADCPGASDNERETAMRQAYSLLAKHNMTLESMSAETNPREIQAKEGHDMVWARAIAISVAELFFCYYVQGKIRKTNRCMHMFIGKRSNAIVASDLTNYLINSTFREGSKRMKKECPEKPYAWRMDFGKGVAAVIYRRCQKLRAQKESELSTDKATGTSIVLADYYKIEHDANVEFMDKAMETYKPKGRARAAGNMDAYASGSEFGNSLPLASGIKDQGNGQLKIK